MAGHAVGLAGYDPAWPGRFEQQRGPVEELLRPRLVRPVEHIGSTSVPGLRAKPVGSHPAGVCHTAATCGDTP